MKKTISLLLTFVLLTGIFASCNKNIDEPSEDESSKIVDTNIITVAINGVEYKISAYNMLPEEGFQVLFDREYKIDGKLSLVTASKGEGYAAVTVKTSLDNGETVYKVIDIETSASADKYNTQIPVNGFVLYIKSDSESLDKIKINTEVIVSGYKPLDTERMDIASVIPENKNCARRLFMVNPKDKIFEENKIYYITNDYEVTVPAGAVAVIFSGYPVSVVSTGELLYEGSEIKNSFALIFCGEYNRLYAEKYYKSGQKIYTVGVDKLNNFTDTAAIVLNETVYNINNINNDEVKDEIQLYTNYYKSPVTPEGAGYTDFVVSDGKVVHIGVTSGKTLIPSFNGFIIKAKTSGTPFGEIALGDSITDYLVEYASYTGRYIKTEKGTYQIIAIDLPLSSQAPSVLYTDSYGKSTETVDASLEIAFKDGKIISVNTSGNTVIPENGYVYSIYSKGSLNSSLSALKKLQEGDIMTAVTGGNQYGFKEFAYTTINSTRNTDYMVIYTSSYGKTTKTNVYGYEIIVDANGIILGDNRSGDSEIPEGGFVISGHRASEDLLKEIYVRGATASYSDGIVKILVTPELGYYNAANILDTRIEKFENAKKQFYNIDYTEISKNLEYISHKLSVAKTHLDKGDINEALIIAESVEIKLIELEYNMYESRAVENRASWYRSNEKSDEQVRATLEKVVECNINALYIETWYNGTVIGYSDNPLIKHNIRAHGDFDVLESFCRIAKEYGVEIHIWVENFFIGGPNDWLAQELKEYLCIDRYGRDTYPTESYGDFAFLNPYDRYCRDLVLGVYREIVENYDIDGIHLDYIRFSEPRNDAENSDFGYNNNVIAGFQEAYNTTVDPHNITSDDHSLWKDWCKFREDIINSFVKEVYDMVQETKPYLWISAATYPAFSSMPQKIFQNFQDWVENGWMDEIFSMSYGSDITYPVGNANSYEKVIGTKAFYSAGLSAFESTAADILIAQISGVRDVGGDGANLFSWGSFINHNLEYAKALKAGIFSRPAVQSYKLSLTVAAGLERLTEDLGGVYMYVKPENSKFYESFKSSIAPILSKAEKFDLKEASDAEKLGYCNNTISDLNGLKEQLISFSDKEVCDSLNLKIDHLINCLKQSISRLS